MHIPNYNSKITEPPNLLKNAGQLWQRRRREVKEITVSQLSSALILFNLIRGKGPDPTGGCVNPS